MKYVVRVRLRGGYDCIGIRGWFRTPRPYPYDERVEGWWCYWVPETVYDQLKEVVKDADVRLRFGRSKVVWDWTEFE
jgi:hypothetical protein